MPQITIKFALPSFTRRFTWEGEASEAAETVAAVEKAAKSQNLDFLAFTVNSVVMPSVCCGPITASRKKWQ